MPGRPETLERVETLAAIPRLYAVVIHNDDYTPMDFVTMILAKIFRKSPAEAERVMLEVHKNGSGVAGVYTFDIAVSKKMTAEALASTSGHPLKFTLTEESPYES